MARRKRYSRKKRSERLSLLYKLVTVAVMIAALVVSIVFFFQINGVLVEGNNKYTDETIIDIVGLYPGDSLFMMNKYEVAQNLMSQLPYIETVQIRRELPSNLVICVQETTSPGYITLSGKNYLVSGYGKIIDTATIQECKNYYPIYGIELTDPTIGGSITATAETDKARECLEDMLSCLQQKKLLENITYIDLSNDSLVEIGYTDRFQLRLNWEDDYSYRFEYLKAVIEKLESNETGVIDLTQDGKASFIPTK